ncbi:ATP synthase subunit J, mitochondrial [Jaminaea rosea]|uniref:ATP synthase subunit J, mitochondrial n=1 Tax=Jaminaea rosea TaxID=1569628 RepID=A0A316URG2_9BASI|nr:ATP synthase subunit J, mitochondrial [Jaminaea rosea]PWN27882.1 ATP synthase subunit J, mitochondrial [Jaminaea rosea]
MFGLRAYPVPVWKPLYPFILGGAIVFYGTVKLQNAMLESDEFKKDPRNPYANKKSGGH